MPNRSVKFVKFVPDCPGKSVSLSVFQKIISTEKIGEIAAKGLWWNQMKSVVAALNIGWLEVRFLFLGVKVPRKDFNFLCVALITESRCFPFYVR